MSTTFRTVVPIGSYVAIANAGEIAVITQLNRGGRVVCKSADPLVGETQFVTVSSGETRAFQNADGKVYFMPFPDSISSEIVEGILYTVAEAAGGGSVPAGYSLYAFKD